MRAMDRSRLFGDVIRAVSLVLDLDEGVKLYHAWRVGVLARRIGQEVAPERADRLYYAGLLHDIGGMGLRDHIIHHAAAGEVSPDAIRHVIEGVRIIQPFPPLAWIAPIVADHHERFDGRGYPHGRAGSEISVSAGVIHLADVLEVVLRSERAGERLARAQRLVDGAGGALCAPQIAEGARRLLAREPGLVEALYDPLQLERMVEEVASLPAEVSVMEPVALLSEMLWLFSRIIDAKHAYTSGHSQRVAYYALAIAEALGSDAFNRWDLLWAGLLHDVGKVGVPRRLLERPGALSEEETERVRLHAQDTIDIIRTISATSSLAYPAAAHHEHYDGTGYPRGLAGDHIPLIGRILAYADTYDGLTSDRAHRRRLSHGEAIEQLRARVGTQLDPGLADAALQALDAAGARPPALPQNVEAFRTFFGLGSPGETASAAPAQRQLVRPVGRGVLLLDIEPWHRAEIDPSGRFLSGGEELAALLGLPAADRLEPLLDDASRVELASMRQELGAGRPSTRYLFSRSGTPLEVVINRAGARDSSADPGGQPSAGSEVTLLLYRTAENRLQSVQQLAVLYRNFISSSEAVCFADPRGRVLDVNRTWLDLAHAKLRDVVGHPLGDLFTVEPPQAEWGPDAGGGKEGGSWSAEVFLRSPQGAAPPVEMRVTPIRDVRGELVGYVAHGVDIRERRLAEARMRRLNRLLSGLGSDYRANVGRVVEAAVDSLRAEVGWYQRPATQGSSGGETQYGPDTRGHDPEGAPAIEVVAVHGAPDAGPAGGGAGTCWLDALHARAGGGAVEGVLPVTEAVRMGAPPAGIMLPESGDLVWHAVRPADQRAGVLALAFPGERSLNATEGAFLGTLAAALATEEEKRATTSALAQSRRELEEKNEVLERMSLLKSDLLAVTSHDLKSPVNAMLSFVNLMLDQLPDLPEADVRRYLERIGSAGNRLLRLIRDLLDVERLDAGLFELRPARTLLDRLVGGVVELHEPLAEQKRVRLRFERRGACPTLRLDADQMERVVANLLSNAVKISGAGQTVTVILDASDPLQVRVQVLDEGPGIPEEELETVFDRYHQVARPGRKGGSGLGLSIVKGIVTLQGGTVWAENRAEGGACFTVALPLDDLRVDVTPSGELRCVVMARPEVEAALAPLFRAAGEELVPMDLDRADDADAPSAWDAPDVVLADPSRLRSTGRRWLRGQLMRQSGPLLVELREAGDLSTVASPADGFGRVLTLPVLDIEVRQLVREVRLRVRRRARAETRQSGMFLDLGREV